MTPSEDLSRLRTLDGLLDDAVHEINTRWGEPWGDDMLPMDQALVRETAEAVLLLIVPERDRFREALMLIDDLSHQDSPDPARLVEDIHRITRTAAFDV